MDDFYAVVGMVCMGLAGLGMTALWFYSQWK